MISNLPTLPPALLEDCLAFSKQLYALKSGVAKLEVSPSHFLFSMNQFPGKKETGSTFSKSQHIRRKKTPSDLRRNALRKAEHLKKKNLPKETVIPPATTEVPLIDPNPGAGENSSRSFIDMSSDTTEDSVNSSMESDTSVIDEQPTNTENTDAMDTLEETVNVPVINQTRNTTETNLGTSDSTVTMEDEPLQRNAKEEIQLLFCSSDEATAKQLSNHNFPKSKYLGPHPKIKNHHFFSIHPTSADVPYLKKDLNYLNKKVNLITLRVLSENKNYFPDQQNHCLECRANHRKK